MPDLAQSFQNLYTYIISITGIIALIGLLTAGVLYLTSAGDPEKLSKARKQILAVFLGTILLVSSYFILQTINLNLVSFEIPVLRNIIIPPVAAPPSETKIPTLLERVEEIAKSTKIASEKIESSGQIIQQLISQCDCANTQPLCYCSGGEEGDSCEPQGCYAELGFHPCPEFREIKENQKRVIAWKEELLYYKNRAIAEAEDLENEIDIILDGQINYYQERLNTETDLEIVQYFNDQIAELEQEKQFKQNLIIQLRYLADLIIQIDAPSLEIAELPDRCLDDVASACNARCSSNRDECFDHDVGDACKPLDCTGGNPCPINSINNQFQGIQVIRPQIDNTSDQILNIIQELIEFKTITI